jgi:hypothetical protein
MECKEFVYGGLPNYSFEGTIDIYNSDVVGVQEVRWEGGGTEPVGEYRNGNQNPELGTGFFSCIRKSYQQLRGLNLF